MDNNFLASIQCVTEEPVPYFVQLSSNYKRSSITSETTTDTDVATRRVYASGLEKIPSVIENTAKQDSETSLCQGRGQGIDSKSEPEGSEVSIGLPDPPQPLSTLTSENKLGYMIKQ